MEEEIEKKESDSEIVPADKSEELKKFKEINADLSITLEKVKKQLAKAKSENKSCIADHNRKRKEIRKLENQLAKSERIQEEHLKNLRAQVQLAIIKKEHFNAEKVKKDKFAAEFFTQSHIANDREKSDISSQSNASRSSLLASTMKSNSFSNSVVSTSIKSNSTKEIKATTKSNESAIFKKSTPSKLCDNLIVNNRQNGKNNMVVSAKVSVTDTVKSLTERSIVSENETSTITAASSRPKRNTGFRSYVEPKLGTKLRRPLI